MTGSPPPRTDSDVDSLPAGLAARLAKIPGIGLKENEPLASHTSMGVGGPARWFITVDRSKMEALAAARDEKEAQR